MKKYKKFSPTERIRHRQYCALMITLVVPSRRQPIHLQVLLPMINSTTATQVCSTATSIRERALRNTPSSQSMQKTLYHQHLSVQTISLVIANLDRLMIFVFLPEVPLLKTHWSEHLQADVELLLIPY